ncbi:hypothetical protein HDV05_008519, partial [Chytridiales sp. JEL 0842]
LYPNTSPQPCPAGTVCCAATGQCDFSGTCPTVTATVPSGPVPTTPVGGPCNGIANGFKTCSADGFSIFTCDSNFIQGTETCLGGSKCCGTTKTCLAPGACPNPSCGSLPDGAILCTESNKFGICASGAVVGSITCGGGTVCCQSKQTCTFPNDCPAPI